MKITKKRLAILAAAVVVVGFGAWLLLSRPKLPAGIAGGNGRLEANQVYVSTKYPGRVAEVLFDEGNSVAADQVVARMDTSTLEAQLREAQAQLKQAEQGRAVALAEINVKRADHDFAVQQNERSKGLVGRGAVSAQEAEIDATRMLASQAELEAAQVEATRAESAIEAAKASTERLEAEIHDSILKSPIVARVDTRLTEPGEVLPAGGRVYSLIDLSDVYMYVFLPESVTGRVRLGSEARIVLDAAPNYPIPAYVSFVSPVAQFTPKTVETAEERHNLTFRVKLQIDKEKLLQIQPFVKAGLPGMGYVRTDERVAWPKKLELRAVNPADLWQSTGSPPAKEDSGPQHEPGVGSTLPQDGAGPATPKSAASPPVPG
jgi:HlyD family secretion protein